MTQMFKDIQLSKEIHAEFLKNSNNHTEETELASI